MNFGNKTFTKVLIDFSKDLEYHDIRFNKDCIEEGGKISNPEDGNTLQTPFKESDYKWIYFYVYLGLQLILLL